VAGCGRVLTCHSTRSENIMTVSFAKDIAPLFTDGDARCMRGMGVYLHEYDYMADPTGDASFADHANARHVLARLDGSVKPRMPPGGPAWSEAQLALLVAWMSAWLP